MRSDAVFILVLKVAVIDAASNPLSRTPFWKETITGYVTLVKKSGKLHDKILPPGLHFTPWMLFGESYIDRPITPQTDCYKDTAAATKDMVKYNIAICVAHKVTPSNIVDVVRTFGLNYGRKDSNEALEIHSELAIKEVVSEYSVMDVQVNKKATMNEEIRDRLKRELEKTYGPVSAKIDIMGVTIKKTEPQLKRLQQEFDTQLKLKNDIRVEEGIIKKEEQKQIELTEILQKQLFAVELKLNTTLENDMKNAVAANKRRDEKNRNDLAAAEADAKVALAKAESEYDKRKMTAELLDNFSSYAEHERAMAYSRVLADKAKFVIEERINNGMKTSTSNANALSYLFG